VEEANNALAWRMLSIFPRILCNRARQQPSEREARMRMDRYVAFSLIGSFVDLRLKQAPPIVKQTKIKFVVILKLFIWS
jgi:hypothetical protein